MKIPRALTVAGSDSGGGAGIQADLKTFNALGVFGMSVLTSITAQNTTGVYGVYDLPPDFVRKQLDVVLEDIGADAVKTGMLSNREIIEAVAEGLRAHRVEVLVVDPVMRAKGGDPLLRPDAQDALVRLILPLALIVTPNLPEAEALTGRPIRSPEDMKEAARRIHDLGPRYVLVKGGHLEGTDRAVDLLFDGQGFTEFIAPRIPTKNTHGTGCTYASAIAAGLAKGLSLLDAVAQAKEFVTGAIRHSLPLGKGHGPVNHFWKLWETRG